MTSKLRSNPFSDMQTNYKDTRKESGKCLRVGYLNGTLEWTFGYAWMGVRRLERTTKGVGRCQMRGWDARSAGGHEAGARQAHGSCYYSLESTG
ncbi:hypothetical protein CDL15_Pgr026263 [Punica granatum]|uniref:Uncharacterized protein n=1 Tax=Punica granatum TaxID=22663 RepID=A0A218VT56_PUNGR|nr:hypothetical protein CDL15_Pgr026263 [Punica granatum]